MPTSSSSLRLHRHYTRQDTLANQLPVINAGLELAYNRPHFIDLKNELKQQLKIALDHLNEGTQLVINLVDIQNDFVLNGFALYVPGGENTVTSNMALLDAIAELIKMDNAVVKRLAIVTSQDAHKLDRKSTDRDVNVIITQYPDTVSEILANEHRELNLFDPAKGHYDLHCMVGTIGAAIATPIARRLSALRQQGIEITSFIKTNFSGPASGLVLPAQVELSDKQYREYNHEIYATQATPQTYCQFFKEKNYSMVYMTGICGNVCVQQAAEGLSQEAGKAVVVIDACQHHLVLPGGKTYDQVRKAVEDSYATSGVTVLTSRYARSNPDCESKAYAVVTPAVAHLCAFYLKYAPACNVMLIALGALVVGLQKSTLLMVDPAVWVAGSLVIAGTFFYSKFERNKQQRNLDLDEKITFPIS